MSSSGPPELPWLIAASVWITWSIVYWLGEMIWRCSALTMPGGDRAREAERVADRDDLVADLDAVGVAERERRQRTGAARSTRRTARSVVGSEPTIVAFKLSLFEKLTWTDLAPATTW